MPALAHRALEAGVEGVTREEGNEGSLPVVSRV